MATMNKYNVWAFLDMHQDALNEKLCGEGVPDWAVSSSNNFPFPVDTPYPINPATGYPYDSDCSKYGFAEYYFAASTALSFQNIYDNVDGLSDALANFWSTVASQFKDIPNLLAYELINEPFCGDIYSHPEYLEPITADFQNLQPLYAKINQAMRKVDNQHIIMFEPVTWADYGSGFTEVPGGDDYKNRSVLSYHHYVPPDINVEDTFLVREQDMERLGCGGFLTEFDINGDPITVGDYAERYKQSWTTWEYKAYVPKTGWSYGFWFPNGTINTAVVKSHSRTYAYAIAGTVVSSEFNAKTSEYNLSYRINPTCKLSTEIYLNEALYYPRGWNITFSPPDVASWSRLEPKNYIKLTHKTDQSVLLFLTIEMVN
eukprot:TRINITY_DN6080_c0_g1_i1.p1 TRINITY_DN6080_c0_g1~~TRINITY_DN6080_c0_g1_i1.p1  ORF type:complete len:410 (-),score=39.87 TRINITY_DN6080_c0_g1_i1:66-1184(-)